ncbi:hypothetical protein OSTOST_06127 [Ostertagia ostertagi]
MLLDFNKNVRSVQLRSQILQNIVAKNLASWTGSKQKSVGLFIEEQSCNGTDQMTNCSLLAACRGQIIDEPPPPIEELIPEDPCADTPMVALSVIESSASFRKKFRFEPNVSYRLRLDGLDMENLKSIKWKIGDNAVDNYDPSKPCHKQGMVVHENGFDLILIEPNETQVVGVVIEAFTGKHRFRIHFLVDRVEDISTYDHRETIEWAGIVAGRKPTESLLE